MKKHKVDVYKKSQVETADQLSLILMLYDRTIYLLDKAKKEISEKKYEEKGYSLSKANNILFELLSALDMEKGGDIATSLSRLYNYVIREIVEADTKLDTKAIDNAKKIMSELRNSWKNLKNNQHSTTRDSDNTQTNINLSG